MSEDYIITNTDDYNGDISEDKGEQSMRKMVNAHPEMFKDKKWDKYRNKQHVIPKARVKEIVQESQKFIYEVAAK